MLFIFLIERIKIGQHPDFLLVISKFQLGESALYSNAVFLLGIIISVEEEVIVIYFSWFQWLV